MLLTFHVLLTPVVNFRNVPASTLSMSLSTSRCFIFALCFAVAALQSAQAGESLVPIGVGKVDITPGYPIRLCGYAARKTESTGIASHLWTKALAIGSDKDRPAILITVDNTGVPASVRNEVVRRLQKSK